MSDIANVVKSKQYVLVAPDGGWGYMICVAAVIIFSCTTSFVPCFGLMFNEFLIEIGMDSTAVTLFNGVNAMSIAIGGILSSPLLNFISLRKLIFLACVVYNFGVYFLVKTHTMFAFFVCQGFLQGTGLGMIYNLTFTVINDYFVKKRLFIISIVQACTAALSMFAPQLVKVTLNEYGYRGMLMFVSAVTLQSFLGVILLQPVAWHMKKVEITKDNVMQELLPVEGIDNVISTIKQDNAEPEEIAYKSNSREKNGRQSVFDKMKTDIFDLPTFFLLVKSFPLWACALTMFADMTNDLILPQGLYDRGWDEGNVAMAISLAGFGDLAARGAFIVLSNLLRKIGSQDMYIIGLFVSTIGKIGMLNTTNITMVFVFVTFIGMGRCFLTVFMPLVISDVVESEKFTMAMGIFLLILGILKMCLGTLIGVIRDYTQSYQITFYVLTSITAICMIAWNVKVIYRRKRNSRNKNRKEII